MSGIWRKVLHHSYSNSSQYFLNSLNLSKTCSTISTSTSKSTKVSRDSSVDKTESAPEQPPAVAGPPSLPSTCCMSGCANCVWLDFAEETVQYYKEMGEEMEFTALLREVEKNIDDPMIKAFITMELKSKYLFKKS
eukprot:TRINITY_DN45726_c0_g1_i1.p1 TRINITY_DN45726_c0_g1~~TRINITY_DN45726_c0_g1_i1.p1  ORF type:complete len:136 (+),score=40.75 TRINITY_DN45726_c0_g1_i1:32-439(+)